MTARERILEAFAHRAADRVPLAGDFREGVWAKLEAWFRTRDRLEIARRLGLDFYKGCVSLRSSEDFLARVKSSGGDRLEISGIGQHPVLYVLTDDGTLQCEWGIVRRCVSTPYGNYQDFVRHPLEDKAGLDGYAFPDLKEPYRASGVAEEIEELKQEWLVWAETPTFYLHSWLLRGMESFMEDLMLDHGFVQALLQRLLEWKLEWVRLVARLGVDAVNVGGDVAMHTGMIMSPKVWRTVFKPLDAAVIAEGRRCGIKYFRFHSDGNILEIIPDLIEVGFDIINPVQPECMDPYLVKERFGDRLVLDGTLSSQQTLPFGSLEEIRSEVRERIRRCGLGGGLVLAPNNVVQPDVPIESLLAVYETAAKEVVPQ